MNGCRTEIPSVNDALLLSFEEPKLNELNGHFKWRLEKGNSDHFPCSVKQPTTLFGQGQQYWTFCPIVFTFSRSLC